MPHLAPADLRSLEEYAEQRPEFRARVLAHKKNRHLPLGENTRLYFEDALTIKYQIQEMLRIEKVFEAYGINEELDRSNDVKTSSVHFMRFESAPSMIAAAHKGEAISAGIDHPAYPVESHPIADTARESLTTDLTQTQVH